MSKAKNKFVRYKHLIERVSNWKYYLYKKMTGFGGSFNFSIKGLGSVKIQEDMLGPFRENFLDDIYLKHVPESIFTRSTSPVILDIGGNAGFFSLATFAKFPQAKIYAFEPHPFCFKSLQAYKKQFSTKDWVIVNTALADKAGELTLNTSTIDGFTTMASVFEQNGEDSVFFTVESMRLDTYLNDNNITQVDFAKVDCEGAEYAILYALPSDFFQKVMSFCVETHRGSNEGENIDALNQFLIEKGYQTKVLDEGDYSGYIWAWRG